MNPTTSGIRWRELENPAEPAHYCDVIGSRSSTALLPSILLLALLTGCAAAPPRDSAHPDVRDAAYVLLFMAAQQLLTSDPTVQSWTPQYGDNMAQWTKTEPGGFWNVSVLRQRRAAVVYESVGVGTVAIRTESRSCRTRPAPRAAMTC